MTNDNLTLGGKTFRSRLFLGTGKFGGMQEMEAAVRSSGSELVTLALKRAGQQEGDAPQLLPVLASTGVSLLPNTSGARTAKEAVFSALLAREAMETNWLKLEIHPDPKYLLPDPVETLEAAAELVKRGFVVLPYCPADPVLCRRLEEVGVAAVMPLGAPIGSNQGLTTRSMLEIIIRQSGVPVVIDAGIGAPSQAAEAMEMGADAVLVNTAIATAGNPQKMAEAFRWAVEAGRSGFLHGLPGSGLQASASSPLTAFLNDRE